MPSVVRGAQFCVRHFRRPNGLTMSPWKRPRKRANTRAVKCQLIQSPCAKIVCTCDRCCGIPHTTNPIRSRSPRTYIHICIEYLCFVYGRLYLAALPISGPTRYLSVGERIQYYKWGLSWEALRVRLVPAPQNAGILMRIIWPPRRSYNLRHICDHLNRLNGQIQDECKWNAGGILNLIKYAIKRIVDLYLFIY